MSIEIRHLADDEREQEIELRKYGFGDAPDDEVEAADLKRMDPAEIIGAFENGKLLAAAQAYRFQQMVRGVPKSCGGVAGVAAFPETRRAGLVAKVINASIAELAEEGVAVSMLHPFKVSFYRRFGYVTTDDTMVAIYPPSAFAHYLSDDVAKNLVAERYGPQEFEQAWSELCDLDRAASDGCHGPILFSSIPPSQPARRLDDRFIVLFRRRTPGVTDSGTAGGASADGAEAGTGGRRDAATGEPGAVVAGMVYRKEGGEPDGTLIIDFYRALPGALPAVLRFVALHIDQCDRARMPVAPMSTTNRLYAMTGDIDGHVRPESSRRPWMVRIIDVAAAINGIPVKTAGDIIIAVTDPGGPCTGVYSLRAGDDHTLAVEQAKTTAKADLNLDQETLCRLLYGADDPWQVLAARRGTGGRDPAASGHAQPAKTLAAWFPEQVLWNDWMF